MFEVIGVIQNAGDFFGAEDGWLLASLRPRDLVVEPALPQRRDIHEAQRGAMNQQGFRADLAVVAQVQEVLPYLFGTQSLG